MRNFFKSLLGALTFFAVIIGANSAVFAVDSTPIVNLAAKLSFTARELERLCEFKIGDDQYALIPIIDAPEYFDFYKKIWVDASPDYMKHYGSGKLKTEAEAREFFDCRFSALWDHEKSIDFTFFIHDANREEFVGIISADYFDSSEIFEPHISYVIEEKFAGKGIATNALGALLAVLQHLVDENKIEARTIYATAHPENFASRRTLEKNGFICDEIPLYFPKYNASRLVYAYRFTKRVSDDSEDVVGYEALDVLPVCA
jgi:RimJ/RimL family protein N-acetyltransferase